MASWSDIVFAGHEMVLDAGLALYWPAKDALVVSDLHLEKSTYLAQFGSAVAPYDTHDTLLRLQALVTRYRPKTLILLGDSFHDHKAWQRLEHGARSQLLDICGSVEACHLVEGNHDVGLVKDGRLSFCDDVMIDGVTFRHEPEGSDRQVIGPQIIGHFHPKLVTHLRGHRVAGKCFAVNRDMLIMPAFGSFTGGLDLTHVAFTALAGNDPFQPYLVVGNTVAARPKTIYSA
ncbi:MULTISPECIES: ligase-associated DNA damage response endonuclease PdeM [Asticcacaulis]|uniref:ligase-associated DNA damage response endonuclease PdeM n=1 Tax=Asticcacaulis TaxID=76890 RepID=UPI001AEB9301|nr:MULTISPECIES: ligase-associated DNA damage response endonuclease PdeM [Asticcacaulis]MBP2159171.1 DNA ligase-associated metallophosphoesterase [Asticcacaulis solisilvae]MDR6800216.1 DNA ligase-associated metallophosphoesterase [Asticcacaulis sp. BE141]